MENAGFTLGDGVPVGFGLALVQDERAVKAFIALSDAQRQNVLDGARRVQSSAEMRAYISSLSAGPSQTAP